jgi:hypothetical protein
MRYSGTNVKSALIPFKVLPRLPERLKRIHSGLPSLLVCIITGIYPIGKYRRVKIICANHHLDRYHDVVHSMETRHIGDSKCIIQI